MLDLPAAGPGAIAVADHRVGYVEAIALAEPLEPTHVVVRERRRRSRPDDRITLAAILAHLPMGARLHGEERGACLDYEYGCVAARLSARRSASMRRIRWRSPSGCSARPTGRAAAPATASTAPGLVQLALQPVRH